MAYDAMNNQVLLIGGYTNTGTNLGIPRPGASTPDARSNPFFASAATGAPAKRGPARPARPGERDLRRDQG